MIEIALAIISGLVLGSMYALAAVGLTLQWGVLKVLNFAHGNFITWGAYFTWLGLFFLGENYPVAILAALIFPFFMGLILYRAVIRPLQERPQAETNIFVATLAIAIALESVIIIFFGGRDKYIPPLIEGFASIGPITINNQLILIMAVAPISLVILMLSLANTKTGAAVRAVAQDVDGAAIVGIESKRMYAYTIAIGGALAGLAGLLLGVIYFLAPEMGTAPLVHALFAMVLGGMGSIKGTIYGAYIIGLIDAFARFFIGMFWASPILFLIFILLLVFRPKGLYGT